MTEHERLLNLLYPNGYPGEWNYDKRVQDYLLKLGTYKVENLIKEPDRLAHDLAVLKEQIQELAVSNYRTFIETAQCSKQLFAQFNNIEGKLEHLLVKVPNFEEKCITFGKKSNGINDLRKLNSLTLTKSAQLIEILELPQLMNSFINDGLYDDAFELAEYVKKLNNKHTDIPIFKSIANDIHKAWLLMFHQLILQLSQELSLSKCLQIVTHLRRMQTFTESELRIKFLQSRDNWFEACLKNIPNDDVNRHLTKTIEVTRVNLFNVLTFYQAIFNDDEHCPIGGIRKGQSINHNVIFYSWMKDKISQFLSTLEEDLKGVSSIESILEQCMYFGSSFSKVGCDFRADMTPIFTRRISENFTGGLSLALKLFEENMEKFTLIDRNHPSIPWKTKNEDPLQPPDSLLEFYPLAEFLNGVLNAFNKLRLCAPIAIIDDIVNGLQDSLTHIADTLLLFYGQEQQAFSSNSKDAFTRLCMSFSDDLVPYIQKCLHVIYPPSTVATMLGVTVSTLQENHVTFLDKSIIIQPISSLLPVKIKPDTSRIAEDSILDESSNSDKEDKVFSVLEDNSTLANESQISES